MILAKASFAPRNRSGKAGSSATAIGPSCQGPKHAACICVPLATVNSCLLPVRASHAKEMCHSLALTLAGCRKLHPGKNQEGHLPTSLQKIKWNSIILFIEGEHTQHLSKCRKKQERRRLREPGPRWPWQKFYDTVVFLKWWNSVHQLHHED